MECEYPFFATLTNTTGTNSANSSAQYRLQTRSQPVMFEFTKAGAVFRWLKAVFTPIALGFLVYFVWLARHDLEKILSESTWWLLLSSIAVWCIFNIISPFLSVMIFRSLGVKLNWWRAFSIHAARLPARYIPGGIWHTVGRIIDYKQNGIQPRHLTSFVILENGLAGSVALAIGGAIVFATRGADTMGVISAASSLATLVALVAIRIFINKRILMGQDRLRLSVYASTICLMTAIWATATIAFLLFLSAFPSFITTHNQIEMAGIYLFSWGVGFVSIFAPQGIGVFEFVTSKLAQSPLGFVGLAALLGTFRIVVLIADLLVWSVFHILRRWFFDTTAANIQRTEKH